MTKNKGEVSVEQKGGGSVTFIVRRDRNLSSQSVSVPKSRPASAR